MAVSTLALRRTVITARIELSSVRPPFAAHGRNASAMGKSEEPRSSPVVNRPCRLCGDSCNGRFIGTIIAPRIIIADVDIAERDRVYLRGVGRRRPAFHDRCRLHRHHHSRAHHHRGVDIAGDDLPHVSGEPRGARDLGGDRTAASTGKRVGEFATVTATASGGEK